MEETASTKMAPLFFLFAKFKFQTIFITLLIIAKTAPIFLSPRDTMSTIPPRSLTQMAANAYDVVSSTFGSISRAAIGTATFFGTKIGEAVRAAGSFKLSEYTPSFLKQAFSPFFSYSGSSGAASSEAALAGNEDAVPELIVLASADDTLPLAEEVKQVEAVQELHLEETPPGFISPQEEVTTAQTKAADTPKAAIEEPRDSVAAMASQATPVFENVFSWLNRTNTPLQPSKEKSNSPRTAVDCLKNFAASLAQATTTAVAAMTSTEAQAKHAAPHIEPPAEVSTEIAPEAAEKVSLLLSLAGDLDRINTSINPPPYQIGGELINNPNHALAWSTPEGRELLNQELEVKKDYQRAVRLLSHDNKDRLTAINIAEAQALLTTALDKLKKFNRIDETSYSVLKQQLEALKIS